MFNPVHKGHNPPFIQIRNYRAAVMPQVLPNKRKSLPAKALQLALFTMENPHFMNISYIDMKDIGKLPHFHRFILQNCANQFMDCHLSRILSPDSDGQMHHILKIVQNRAAKRNPLPKNQKLKPGASLPSKRKTVNLTVR